MFEGIYSVADLHTKQWFQNLPRPQKELLLQGIYLLEDTQQHSRTFFDYSFVVMPAAKAYEGFVKDLLLNLRLISRKRYEGKRFRVGKALNPDIALHYPHSFEILYDDLERICEDPEIPKRLWQTWLDCRNHVFHYFVKEPQMITLYQAKTKLQQVFVTIEETVLGCRR